MSKRSAVALLLLSLYGCTGTTHGDLDDEDIQEAVLRWAFRNADTELTPPAAYCLVYAQDAGHLAPSDPGDPPGTLLHRFRGDSIPVRPYSACRFTSGHYVVVDSLSGGPSLLFEYGPVEYTEGGAAIGVGYIQGSEWGRGWRCTVNKRSGSREVHCDRRVDI